MERNSRMEYSYPKKRRRRRRTYFSGIANFLALAVAVMLLAAVGMMFAQGAEEGVQITVGDLDAPRIYGVADITVYMGETVSYRSGITVVDDVDEFPVLTVDSSRVDLSAPGIYEVTYTATDKAGNAAKVTASVTVLEKLQTTADLDEVYAAADALLSQIVTENMTAKQSVKAIYVWARTSLSYSGHTDKTDFYQAAYSMLTGGSGDCYGFYAVTKLLFDRLGIPNIDVRKVKSSPDDSDHYWSLVSVDGGESYYHFDATPRVGDGDNFCLVTDSFLDAYSDANGGSHNRDKSLYPATPEV